MEAQKVGLSLAQYVEALVLQRDNNIRQKSNYEEENSDLLQENEDLRTQLEEATEENNDLRRELIEAESETERRQAKEQNPLIGGEHKKKFKKLLKKLMEKYPDLSKDELLLICMDYVLVNEERTIIKEIQYFISCLPKAETNQKAKA